MDNLEQKIQQGIEAYMRNRQFNYSKIPSHEHNGVDTVKISRVNIINATKITAGITANTVGSDKLPISTPNLNRVVFMGILANNAGGGTATKRFILNGQAEIGNCQFYNGNVVSNNVIAIENYMYVDSADLTKNRVGAGNGLSINDTNYLVYAKDDTSTVIGAMTVTYDGKFLTFNTITLASGWILTGYLLIT